MQANIDRVAGFIREAAGQGADVVLPPELFCGYYFCKTQEEHHFARALPWHDHPAVVQLGELAAELGVVIPVSSARAIFRTVPATRKNTIFGRAIRVSAPGRP